MVTTRQATILKAIVEEFIKTAQPVGSKTLMTTYKLPYSSATIRNEMMALENENLLEKTHTSSGRIPSTLGYRYYVEHLMDPIINEEEKQEIATVFDNSKFSFEEAIQKSCDVVSHMTSLTSIVLGPDAKSQKLRHIKMFPIDEQTAVAVFITDQGHTENKTFHFDESVSVDDITKCTEILNDRLSGTPVEQIAEKMESIKPILAKEVKRAEVLFNAFLQAFIKFASRSMYYSGAGNMLYQPEFSDIDKLKDLMKMLEDSSAWKQITSNANSTALKNADNDSELIWTDDYAIATKKLMTDDKEQAQLMVLGPRRMNYEEILSILNYTAEVFKQHYGKKKK